jgi:hypothetical protein
MPVQITGDEFILNGTSSKLVAKTLKGAGLDDSRVAEIIGGWFIGVTGAAQPSPFDFTTDVQTTDPNCAITYSPQFTHFDWIDGESRVQAGLTPEELGLNARFHALENEFGAIAQQFTQLGSCVAETRSDLVGVVGELEAKITALQNEIHALKQAKKADQKPTILGTTKVADKEVLITQFEDKFRFVDFGSQVVGGLAGGGAVGPRPDVFDPIAWQPEEFVDFSDGLRKTFTSPEVQELWAAGTPVTVADLRAAPATATLVLPTGEALGSVLAGLSPETSFENVNQAVGIVLEHTVSELPDVNAGAVRTSVLTGEAVDRTGAALLNSSVVGLGVDVAMAKVLSTAGLRTVGDLATADPLVVASALAGAGADPTVAGSLVARAGVASALRNVGRR